MSVSQLPVSRQFSQAYSLSLVVAFLLAAASLAGIFLQSTVYPTPALRQISVSNDVVNLGLGLPILLGSMALARRGRLIGLLFWPGALFYVAYNYTAFAVAQPFTIPFVLYLALVIVSVYSLYLLLGGIDAAAVQRQLEGRVFERLAAGVLVFFGVAFFLLAISEIAAYFTRQSEYSWPELSVRFADLLTCPAWLAGGILLWRRRALGYVSGAGLLFQASMLFVGLLIFFVLQPALSGAPFRTDEFVQILVMSLICFAPFGLFVRGVLKAD